MGAKELFDKAKGKVTPRTRGVTTHIPLIVERDERGSFLASLSYAPAGEGEYYLIFHSPDLGTKVKIVPSDELRKICEELNLNCARSASKKVVGFFWGDTWEISPNWIIRLDFKGYDGDEGWWGEADLIPQSEAVTIRNFYYDYDETRKEEFRAWRLSDTDYDVVDEDAVKEMDEAILNSSSLEEAMEKSVVLRELLELAGDAVWENIDDRDYMVAEVFNGELSPEARRKLKNWLKNHPDGKYVERYMKD